MALWRRSPSTFSLLQSPMLASIPKSSISKTLTAVQSTTKCKNHVVSISSVSPGLRCPCLRCCSTDDESLSDRIFGKGVPESSFEVSVKKAFSQFGEVRKGHKFTNDIWDLHAFRVCSISYGGE